MEKAIIFCCKSLLLAGLYFMVSAYLFDTGATILTLLQSLFFGGVLTLILNKFSNTKKTQNEKF